ncbi:MAG: Poly(A) polymerase (EC [uncultured Thiotrichaceae bacterium]|uniref:Poly(A) polymerase I n=1 Tax=uncultured Thiotrichaceae bacterium TaxID=298394 RepID=A0A6S6U0K8_9GAMM|nr:MAG: Poly(A) polymerase (EC [uncultured Thiotrichaceae bacterium]
MVNRLSPTQHSIVEKRICKKARDILHRLERADHEAYLVGGAVRDLLLNHSPKDFDIATSAHPEEVKKIFPSCRLIGRRFRLAHIHYGREYLEVATFRAPHNESESGKTSEKGRIINDNVYGSMEEDALRRDFTINALFYDIQTGDVVDHADGIDDLEKREIRLIGDPETRYREDPVRMLRAIRFAIKLDFTIEATTEKPIYELGHLLKDIAPARLFDETLKLFHSGNALKTFRMLRQYDLFQYLFPQTEDSLLREENEDFLTFIETALKNTDKRIRSNFSVTPAFLFAVMLWDKTLEGFERYRSDGQPEYQSMQLSASDVIGLQAKSTAVPRRFSNVSRDIWLLQARFRRKDCRAVFSFIEHKRFRAAYDFFCLRARSGHLPVEDCEWWTEFQTLTHDEQMEACQEFAAPKRRSNRRRKRK